MGGTVIQPEHAQEPTHRLLIPILRAFRNLSDFYRTIIAPLMSTSCKGVDRL
jgi:hypothetical protein